MCNYRKTLKISYCDNITNEKVLEYIRKKDSIGKL